ncbi:MAG: DUF1127 domain-containing protein [Alphaproteobacteria bacterium]|nr:DUF1127 domain-containing protein [Alphaproteobacteria bacterium]
MDDHILADIGVTRSDVEIALSRRDFRDPSVQLALAQRGPPASPAHAPPLGPARKRICSPHRKTTARPFPLSCPRPCRPLADTPARLLRGGLLIEGDPSAAGATPGRRSKKLSKLRIWLS